MIQHKSPIRAAGAATAPAAIDDEMRKRAREARKPTLLDQLTSSTISPSILRIRASYWRTVADRNERAGRVDQAKRVRTNCLALERQADEMERSPVPSIVPPATVTQRRPSRTACMSSAIGAEQFWTLHGQAVASIVGKYGLHWAIRAAHGETVLATIPSKLRSFKGERGTVIRYRPELRIPAASFWPEGRFPVDLVLQNDPKRDRAIGFSKKGALICAPIDRNAAWWKAHGCVLRGGKWIHEREARVLDAQYEPFIVKQVREDIDRAIRDGTIGEECVYADHNAI